MQNLTPLEIQKQTFSTSLRGYSSDDVRAYLHLIAEEMERLLKDVEKLSRENLLIREEVTDFTERERILKDTLLSAQKLSEEMKANARKEAELIVKDAELLSERIVSQALERVHDLERTIQELKLQRKAVRNKLNASIETYQQMVLLDAEQEASELPLTYLYKKTHESG